MNWHTAGPDIDYEAVDVEWLNALVEKAPDCWDGDDAQEAITLDYVRHLEAQVIDLGGTLHRCIDPRRQATHALWGSVVPYGETGAAIQVTLFGACKLLSHAEAIDIAHALTAAVKGRPVPQCHG